MTRFASKFDIVSRDPHPNAQAGLMLIWDVDSSLLPSPMHSPEGTPVPGILPAGTIMMLNPATGAALKGVGIADITANFRKIFAVTIDGDMDFDGAQFHRLTCIQGGMEIVTDQFVDGVGLVPGAPLTVGNGGSAGKFILATDVKNQLYGFVGADGKDATNGILSVIVPQGV